MSTFANVIILVIVTVFCVSCGEVLSDPVNIRIDNTSLMVDGQEFFGIEEIDSSVLPRGVGVRLEVHKCTDRGRLTALLEHIRKIMAENQNTGINVLGNMVEIHTFGESGDEACVDVAT